MGLSQQKLADILGVKRGKVAGYFYETQAKPIFHQKLIDHFHLDLGRFLTLEMNDSNYDSFFSSAQQELSKAMDPDGSYEMRLDAINILLKAKSSPGKAERDQLIDEAIGAYGKLISENSTLKDQVLSLLQDKE